MNDQLYTAASGLIVEERRLELTANNLANVSTPGFRASRAFTSVFESRTGDAPSNSRSINRAVALAGTYAEPGPGPMEPTERALDVGLRDEGLLVVESPAGRAYTRAGNLLIAPDGTLTDGAGNPVLGEGGGRLEGLSPSTTITADGNIVDGPAILGRLMVVRDPSKILLQAGSNLMSAGGQDDLLETVDEPQLMPGWLERSGTEPVRELVYLLESQRAFESYQKLITLTNDVNRRAVNEIAGG